MLRAEHDIDGFGLKMGKASRQAWMSTPLNPILGVQCCFISLAARKVSGSGQRPLGADNLVMTLARLSGAKVMHGSTQGHVRVALINRESKGRMRPFSISIAGFGATNSLSRGRRDRHETLSQLYGVPQDLALNAVFRGTRASGFLVYVWSCLPQLPRRRYKAQTEWCFTHST
jgi:hypothetical protein